MPTKPDKLPRWADVPTNNGPSSEPNVFEPTELKKDRGWDWDERPPREHFNWLHLKTYEWLDYHRDLWDNAGAVTLNFAIDEANTSGLTLGLLSGTAARRQGVFTVAANTYALTASSTNQVYLDLASQTIVATAGALPTYNVLPLYTLVTDGSGITSTTDDRTWLTHPAQLVQDPNNYLDLQDSLLSLTMDGVNRFLVTDTQVQAIPGGVGSGYSFIGDTVTGVTSDGSGALTLYANTSGQATLNTTGFGIGTSPSYRLHIGDTGLEAFITDLAGTPTLEVGTTTVEANGAVVAQHKYRGQDSANSATTYVQTYGLSIVTTTGAEDGEFRIDAMRAGSLTSFGRLGINLGEDYGTRLANILDIAGTSPKLKLSTGAGSTDDGFQIHTDFTGNGVTGLLGFDTDVITIKPNNQEGVYIRWSGSSTGVGINGITNPLDAIHVEGSIRAGGASGSTLSAYFNGNVDFARVFNTASRKGLEDNVYGEMISRDKSTGKVFIDGPVGVNTTDAQCDLEVNGSFCATEILGNSYAETSESGNTSIVDTGVTPEAGAVYDIIITGNPNSAGSPAYRSTIHLLAYITVGNDGPTVTQYVDTVEQFSVSGLHATGGNEIQAAVTFWDGASESDDFPVATSVQLRVKVSGYNLADVGANQTVRIKKVN